MRALFVLGALSFVGCFSPVCTLELRRSLSITAEDENGVRVSPESVTVTREDGSEVRVDCVEQDPQGACIGFAAGEEESGTFVVTGIFQGLSASEEVTVSKDECHVQSESVVLVFVP